MTLWDNIKETYYKNTLGVSENKSGERKAKKKNLLEEIVVDFFFKSDEPYK